MKLYYIADEKMYCFDGRQTEELHSTVYDGYTERLYYNAKASEWKTQGQGARFTQTFDPNSAEDKLQNVSVYTDCLFPTDDTVFFTQTIDGVSGLYRKQQGANDGIVFSDNAQMYTHFDFHRDQFVVSVESAGESHIAICPKDSVYVRTLTEAETRDSHPVWSRFEDGVIYYSSSGLELRSSRTDDDKPDSTPFGRMLTVQRNIHRPVGPSSICRFDVPHGDIHEILTNDKLDFTHPFTDHNGNLYFIRKPYRPAAKHNVTALGCLLDIVLFPFRLCRALLGFLNIFSMVYSGKALHKSGASAAKEKDEKSIYLDGNMINAEKELKRNKKQGYQNPGIIPRSFELCRISPNGDVTVLKKGVIAYTVTNDGIYYSNGSAILHLDHHGNETVITKASRVTMLSVLEEDPS